MSTVGLVLAIIISVCSGTYIMNGGNAGGFVGYGYDGDESYGFGGIIGGGFPSNGPSYMSGSMGRFPSVGGVIAGASGPGGYAYGGYGRGSFGGSAGFVGGRRFPGYRRYPSGNGRFSY